MDWQETILSALRTFDGRTTVAVIVWAVYLGIMFGALFGYYHKKIIGSFVRALCDAKAFSADAARTPDEIGQEGNRYALRALKRRSGALRNLVSGSDGRYYIEGEKNMIRAGSQFKPDNSNLFLALLIAVALIAVGVAVFLAVPIIIDNFKSL